MNRFFSVMALGVALLAAGAAHCAPGDLDPTFGSAGRVSLRLANDVVPADVAVQVDGRIVVATGLNNTPLATQAFGVVRFTASGALDGTFGRGGIAMASFTNFINSPSALALQPDGRIVVVGNATGADGTLSEFALARFDADGSLDESFGDGGKVTTNFVGVQPGGVRNPATTVLLLPNGELLVAGLASECADCIHYTALALYLPDGRLDTRFGRGGTVQADAIGAPNALALLANGHVLALAADQVAEFTPRGRLVTVVSTTTGKRLLRSSHVGTSLFEPGGEFLFAHGARGPMGENDIDIQVTRHEPLGNIDRRYASAVFDFNPVSLPLADVAQAVALQQDGRLVVAGYSTGADFSLDFGIARLNGDGTLDASFGSGGTVITSFDDFPRASSSFVNALALQPDGRIVALGLTGTTDGGTRLSLARYLAR